MIKTKTWIIVISALLLVSLAASALVFLFPKSGTIANIYIDGECVRSIDLSEVTDSYEFTLDACGGKNTVRVEHGRICVCDADCPDKTCVKTAWIGDTAAPIVCLPHRLVIRIEDKNGGKDDAADFDAVSR